MIKITCDKCGKELDWRKHPAFVMFDPSVFQHSYSCSSSVFTDTEYNTIQSVTVKEKDGLRMLDLCDKCKAEIFNYISFENEVARLKEVNHDQSHNF